MKYETKQRKKVDIADSNDAAVMVVLAVWSDGVDDAVVAKNDVGKDDVEMDGADKVNLMVD